MNEVVITNEELKELGFKQKKSGIFSYKINFKEISLKLKFKLYTDLDKLVIKGSVKKNNTLETSVVIYQGGVLNKDVLEDILRDFRGY